MAIEDLPEGPSRMKGDDSIFVRREPVLSPTESDNGNYGSEENSPLSASTIIDTRFYTKEETVELMAEISYWLGIDEEQFEIRGKSLLINFACRISRIDFEKELKEAIDLEVPPGIARHIYIMENQGNFLPKNLVEINKKAREQGFIVRRQVNGGLKLIGATPDEGPFFYRRNEHKRLQRTERKINPCGAKIEEHIPLSRRQQKIEERHKQ